MPSPVYALASDYVDRVAALDPIVATGIGVPGYEERLPDFSPDGEERRVEHTRETLRALDALPAEGEQDRVAAEVMRERLALDLDLHAAGEPLRHLNVLMSPMQSIRQVFDLMPRATEEDWAHIAARMLAVPQAIEGLRATLAHDIERGRVVSKRQVDACAQQATVWSGRDAPASFFAALASEFERSGVSAPALREQLDAAGREAAEAYAALADFLRDDYRPFAADTDPVGADRYALGARLFNGTTLDLEETYAWGWSEVERIQREVRETIERIAPGRSVDETIERLESDPVHAIEGVEPFREWMQELQDRTIAALHGTHFDIPEPVRRIEAMIAPEGGALAMYYTGPSEDFSRPGRTWYPTGGKTTFPLWREVSIAHHEGVPGHHLQIGTVTYLSETLSRYQRLLAGTSGHAEGWALYAERLMAELGYLDDPAAYLGMLVSQALRAARVVVDIGLHLELPVPAEHRELAGAEWTPEGAHRFLLTTSHFPPEFLASEVTRYLGIPGQAISYKVGERVWMETRSGVIGAGAEAPDLKTFHTRMLALGPMGLDQLRRESAATFAPPA